jgi:hypothetical protein
VIQIKATSPLRDRFPKKAAIGIKIYVSPRLQASRAKSLPFSRKDTPEKLLHTHNPSNKLIKATSPLRDSQKSSNRDKDSSQIRTFTTDVDWIAIVGCLSTEPSSPRGVGYPVQCQEIDLSIAVLQ